MITGQMQNLAIIPVIKMLGNINKGFSSRWLILAIKSVGSLGELVEKGKFVTKIFFQIMLNEIKKSCKK